MKMWISTLTQVRISEERNCLSSVYAVSKSKRVCNYILFFLKIKKIKENTLGLYK